jgi:hypothetical protein
MSEVPTDKFHIALNQVLGGEKTEIKSAGPRSTNLIVRAQNRVEASDNVKKKFKQKQIKFEEKVISSHSGYPCIVVKLSDKSTFTIIYKTSSDAKVSTALAESAQAVYASIAFNVKRGNITEADLTSANFTKAMTKADVTSTLQDVEKKLTDDWVLSSVKGANLLRQRYSGKQFECHRGSRKVGIIEAAFTKVKQKEGLSVNLNKWSPADIYLIEPGFDPSPLKEENTILGLNALMFKYLTEEKVIGVSLKKLGNTGNISEINYPTDKTAPTFTYVGVESPPASTSGYILMKKGNSQMKINFRTFTASGGWSGEVLVPGGTARHGKISHGPLNDVLKAHGVKQITDNIPSRNAASKNSDTTAKKMAKSMVKHGFVPSKDEEAIVNMIKSSNVNYRQSKFLVQELFDNLPLNDKKKMDQLVEDMYRYAGSIIKGVSGPYIKMM